MKLQRGIRIACQFMALSTVVVGKPDQATRIEPLDQHNAGRRPQVTGDGCQRHGIGLWYFGCNSFIHPAGKQIQRIGWCRTLVQRGQVITFSPVGDIAKYGDSGSIV